MEKATSCRIEAGTLRRAAELLRAGRLVAFPTETVYGLGANALDEVAVRRVFEVKGRPATSPLIVHVSSIEMARNTVVREWPAAAQKLAERFWPGPLTLVLPKRAQIPDIVTAGLDTVGVRMPAAPDILEMIDYAGVPVAAPSANRFTEVSPTTAEHVRESLDGAVDLILEGEPSRIGIESTVLSLAGARPVLLRPGMITTGEIESLIGPVTIAGPVANGAAHASPGLHRKHYSPRTRVVLVDGGRLPESGRGAYLRIATAAPAARAVQMPADANGYAARLYAVLHELDGEGWDWIAVETPPDAPEWAGIRDRLQRAAAQ